MEGKTLTYGGCGAVKTIKNPIELAYNICIKQSESLPLGLVPPSLLVGKGAALFAKKLGLKTVNNERLISQKALKQYTKYKTMLESTKNNSGDLLDTVGAVCMDLDGNVAAACSSGKKII